VQLVLKGFEKELEKRVKRITGLNTLLQIHISEFTLQLNQQAQLRKRLRPSTTEYIPQNLEGTLEWIWSHETFSRWLEP
jgi:hypothetical protein